MRSPQTERKTLLSDEESKRLGKLILQKDPRGCDKLLRWYLPHMRGMARKIAWQYKVDSSELESVGYETLGKIAPTWDYRVAKFSTFATQCLMRDFIRCVRQIRASRAYSLDAPVGHAKSEENEKITFADLVEDPHRPDTCLELVEDLLHAPRRIADMLQIVANMTCKQKSEECRKKFEENKRLFLELYGLGAGAEAWGAQKTLREGQTVGGKSNQRIGQVEKRMWEKIFASIQYTKEKLWQDIEATLTFRELGLGLS